MPHRLYGILALLIVTIVWGTTFPAMKELIEHFSSLSIVSIRFTLAGVLLSPFLLRAKSADYLAGIALGLVLIVCYFLQLEGLALTSSNRNAFVIGLNVLVVPLLGMATGKLPERRIVIAIMLALAGLFALCWDGGGWGPGDTYALWGALAFGIYIKLMEAMTRKVTDLLALTAVQVIVVALCSALWLTFGIERSAPLDWARAHAAIAPYFWNFIYLGVVATAGIMFLQAWGQRRTSANEAAVIYAMEPACAAAAAYFWIGETMMWRGVLGGMLMLGGMIVSQWQSRDQAPAETRY